jgi:hypothetical protein
VLVAFVALYILVFMLPGRLWFATAEGPVSGEMLRIRATGTCAFLLLSLVLSIGPRRGSTGASCRCSRTAGISAR